MKPCRRSLHPYSLYRYHSSNFQNPNYLHLSTSKFLPIIINMYIGTGSDVLNSMYLCSGLVTFVKSFPPIQEFPLNLALIKELASLSGIVARIALPSALHALRACKKHEKNGKNICLLEGGHQNLWQPPFLGTFWPYTEISFTKLKFRRSFWDVEWVWTSIGAKVMTQKVFFSSCGFLQFCKKNSWKCCDKLF